MCICVCVKFPSIDLIWSRSILFFMKSIHHVVSQLLGTMPYSVCLYFSSIYGFCSNVIVLWWIFTGWIKFLRAHQYSALTFSWGCPALSWGWLQAGSVPHEMEDKLQQNVIFFLRHCLSRSRCFRSIILLQVQKVFPGNTATIFSERQVSGNCCFSIYRWTNGSLLSFSFTNYRLSTLFKVLG